MCRLALSVAVLALITSLTRSDAAQAFPFSSWSHGHPTVEAVACRPLLLGTADLRGKLRSCAPNFGAAVLIEIRAVIITAASECIGCDVCYGEFHYCNVSPSRASHARSSASTRARS